MDAENAITELESIKTKLQQVVQLINDYEGTKHQDRAIEVKFKSITRRIQLVPETDDAITDLRTEVIEMLELAEAKYAHMVEAIGTEEEEPMQTNPHGTASTSSRKHVPVARWGIQFAGEKKDLSLGAFLERVHELMEARNVSKPDMWAEAVDLFSGQALLWFRSARRRLDTWDQLVSELKKEFQPRDYDHQLKSEILNRTQGSDEKIAIYLAAMDNLFHRLLNPVEEQEQLQIILRNLQPHYSNKLIFQNVPTLDKLRRLCRRIEEEKQKTETFRQPPDTRNSLEPDLGYVATKKSHMATIEASNSTRAPTQCWNCLTAGHRYRQCPHLLKISFCKGCGTTNALLKKQYCTSCSGKGRGGRY
jgi:Retrotransposon gag protein